MEKGRAVKRKEEEVHLSGFPANVTGWYVVRCVFGSVFWSVSLCHSLDFVVQSFFSLPLSQSIDEESQSFEVMEREACGGMEVDGPECQISHT